SDLHCTEKSPCAALQGDVYPQQFEPGPLGLSHGGGGVVDFLTDAIDLGSLDGEDYTIVVRAFNIFGQVQERALNVTIQRSFTVTVVCSAPPDSSNALVVLDVGASTALLSKGAVVGP